MKSAELRKKFLDFFERNGHTIAPSSSLLPTDPSVLFTTAGMQQFKPYYLGEKSPWGQNVVSCQKCIRTSDIEEVGDERHLTFFEMLGNFSFGGYWKKEAIQYAYDFVVKELGLTIDYVTVFEGEGNVPEDTESAEIWKSIDKNVVVKKFGRADNFWGPTGEEGPCGPTTEIYVNGIEIWNIVFNEFYQEKDKTLKPLEIKGVDTGMGLERLAMVVQKVPTVFETDLFEPIIEKIEKLSGKKYKDYEKEFRIIADHMKSALFLTVEGVYPDNKESRGSTLFNLIRDSINTGIRMGLNSEKGFYKLTEVIISVYKDTEYLKQKLEIRKIENNINYEFDRASKLMVTGISDTTTAMSRPDFNPYDWRATSGVPYEIIKEQWLRKYPYRSTEFDLIYEKGKKKHQELSRTASAGMFKGGLADHEPATVKLHTAHHLLLAALQEMFGKQVKQRGSNINQERLRIDFSFDRKLTDEEKKKLEELVQSKIDAGLAVDKREMSLGEAQKIGAEMEFGVKYGNTVSVYFIEDKNGTVFSKEFCGGPHVNNTKELGRFKIIKEEASSQGVRRIKAILE